MADFIPGLELSRLFYEQAVLRVLAETFPGLIHSAARIGSGSEVLGFDTPRSADHEWGPRLQLFLDPADHARVCEQLTQALAHRLPREFLGWSTHFEPAEAAVRRMQPTTGLVRHRVDIVTIAGWCQDRLGFDPRGGPSTFDWLATSTQRLAETVGGAVFHDGLGELGPLRSRLDWYPPEIWRFLLACQWRRVAQEEAFPGRCDEVGDELGSRTVTARLARDLMRLSLLMQRRYPPYGKWLGSALARSPYGPELTTLLAGALHAPTWAEREQQLGAAYRLLARQHNSLGLTEQLPEATGNYHDRPFLVLQADRFASALQATLGGGPLAAVPLFGAVDQFIDSTDVLTDPGKTRALAAALYADLR